MSRALALLCLLPVALGSSAWTEFVNYKAPVAAPQDGASALNLASTRRSTSGAFAIQQSSAVDGARWVVPNSFTAGGLTASDDLKLRVFELCKNHSAGTSFEAVVKNAWDSASSLSTTAAKAALMPPQCAMCLGLGWGADNKNWNTANAGSRDPTPGFYLPCGCQETCVDVSGNSKAAFNQIPSSASLYGYSEDSSTYKVLGASTRSQPFPAAVNIITGGSTPSLSSAQYTSLNTCQDYLDNRLVYSCNQIAEFQTMIWAGILMAIIFVYVAISMSGMSLDMDSLLYTVGSSGSKKDQ